MARFYGVVDGGSPIEGSGLMIMVGMVVMSVLMISMVIFNCGDSSNGERKRWGNGGFYGGGGGGCGGGGGGCGGGGGGC
ncbi:hypothetical protein P3S67_016606 [Capsicum chacoense]|uniref:Uncharacterized protein n=1 Tax=Capsicum annuum TaxID=4072 RepID=A0A2G2Z4L7_CAPAN|nr:hypothetical protein FXO38_05925 [Capsicum annuum]KAF3675360.1 hypothetical protein FXO37_05908 [Capsicum annuum]PHT76919.1 hypothetical protein T459_20441 [Capsicum annuum]